MKRLTTSLLLALAALSIAPAVGQPRIAWPHCEGMWAIWMPGPRITPELRNGVWEFLISLDEWENLSVSLQQNMKVAVEACMEREPSIRSAKIVIGSPERIAGRRAKYPPDTIGPVLGDCPRQRDGGVGCDEPPSH